VALALSPFLIRNLRSSMIREMAADHVTAARSRGLPARAIFRNHVFLNALIPAVTLLGVNIGWLIAARWWWNRYSRFRLGRVDRGIHHCPRLSRGAAIAMLMAIAFSFRNFFSISPRRRSTRG